METDGWKDWMEMHPSFERYADEAEAYMYKNSIDERELVRLTRKNFENAKINPLVKYHMQDLWFDIAEYESRVWYPFTVHMYAPEATGCAAVLVCSSRGLRKLQIASARAVKVLACTTASAVEADVSLPVTTRAARDAYKEACVLPTDLSFAKVNDITAVSEAAQTERLDFFDVGEAFEAVMKGKTQIGGALPINTSGGLLARGHAPSATGLAQLHEAVMQLRGECGQRQVRDARIGLAQMSSGLRFRDDAMSCVTKLGRCE